MMMVMMCVGGVLRHRGGAVNEAGSRRGKGKAGPTSRAVSVPVRVAEDRTKS